MTFDSFSQYYLKKLVIPKIYFKSFTTQKIYFKSFTNKLWTRSTLCWFFACLFQVTFQKLWHGWNRRTKWSRVLSGRSISRSLSLFASAVQWRYQSSHASSDNFGVWHKLPSLLLDKLEWPVNTELMCYNILGNTCHILVLPREC